MTDDNKTNPVSMWDFRTNAEGLTKDALIIQLKKIAKHYVFQLEKGEQTGYLHYQGRLSLIKKHRKSELLKMFSPNYLAPSANPTFFRGEMFYVMKEETRVDGPWDERQEVQSYIPRQIREVEQLRPWQQFIVDDSKMWDKRTINVLYDTTGNNGKSVLKTYIGVYQIGRALPFTNDYKDMLRMVMDTKKRPLYIIDIPRALKKDTMFNFFSAIETLKDGYAYDDRYSFKEEYFDCPNIWVFMNTIPDLEYLSPDRWKFWKIKENNLIQFNIFDFTD